MRKLMTLFIIYIVGIFCFVNAQYNNDDLFGNAWNIETEYVFDAQNQSYLCLFSYPTSHNVVSNSNYYTIAQYIGYNIDCNGSTDIKVRQYDGSGRVLIGDTVSEAGDQSQLGNSFLVNQNGIYYLLVENSGARVYSYNSGTNSRFIVGGSSFSSGNIGYRSMTVGNDGYPIVTYQDEVNDNKTAVIKYNGIIREAVGSLRISDGLSAYQYVMIDNDGNPVVAYQDGMNNNKTTVKKYDGTSWYFLGTSGFSSGGDQQTLLINEIGTKYLAYRNTQDNKAEVWIYTGDSRVKSRTSDESTDKIAMNLYSTMYPLLAYKNSNLHLITYQYNGSSWTEIGGTCSNGINSYQTECEGKGICSDPSLFDESSCEGNGICTDQSKIHQNDCENSSSCFSYLGIFLGNYMDQTNCENNGICSDINYINQITCENAGACYDRDFNNIDGINDSTSCYQDGYCENGYDSSLEDSHTTKTDCENNGVCVDYFGMNGILTEYNNQIDCQNDGSCSDPNYTLEAECLSTFGCSDPNYNNENDCINNGICQGRLGSKCGLYNTSASCMGIAGCSRSSNYRGTINTWEQHVRYLHNWIGNFRYPNQRNGNYRALNQRSYNSWLSNTWTRGIGENVDFIGVVNTKNNDKIINFAKLINGAGGLTNDIYYGIYKYGRGLPNYLIGKSYSFSDGIYFGNTGLNFNTITKNIGLSQLDVSVKMFSSSDHAYSVAFQNNTKFTHGPSQVNYTGTLNPPIPINTTTVSNVPGNPVVYAGIRIGNGSRINLVNTSSVETPATITIPVDASLNGTEVQIYYSDDYGSSWNSLTTKFVSNGSVTFQATHFTDFIVSKIQSTPNTSNGGGGGGGGISIDYCPDGDNSPSYYDKSCGAIKATTTNGTIKKPINESVIFDYCPKGDLSPTKHDGLCYATDDVSVYVKFRIIHGYKNDGKTWLLNNNITYYEMAKIIIRTLTTQKYQPSYVGKDRGTRYIQDMKKLGLGDYTKVDGHSKIDSQVMLDVIIKGLKIQGKLDPSYNTPKVKKTTKVTKGEMLKIVVKYFLDEKLLEDDTWLQDKEWNTLNTSKTVEIDDFQNLIKTISIK